MHCNGAWMKNTFIFLCIFNGSMCRNCCRLSNALCFFWALKKNYFLFKDFWEDHIFCIGYYSYYYYYFSIFIIFKFKIFNEIQFNICLLLFLFSRTGYTLSWNTSMEETWCIISSAWANLRSRRQCKHNHWTFVSSAENKDRGIENCLPFKQPLVFVGRFSFTGVNIWFSVLAGFTQQRSLLACFSCTERESSTGG